MASPRDQSSSLRSLTGPAPLTRAALRENERQSPANARFVVGVQRPNPMSWLTGVRQSRSSESRPFDDSGRERVRGPDVRHVFRNKGLPPIPWPSGASQTHCDRSRPGSPRPWTPSRSPPGSPVLDLTQDEDGARLVSQDKALEVLTNMWNTRAFTDMTIQCGDQEIKVHRCVVAPQWDYMKEVKLHTIIVTERHKHGDDIPAITLILEPKTGDHLHRSAIRTMLVYFYTGDMLAQPDTGGFRLRDGEASAMYATAIRLALLVWRLAVAYELAGLRAQATAVYCYCLRALLDSASCTLTNTASSKVVAESLTALYADDMEDADAEELRDPTLYFVGRYAHILLADEEACRMLEGKPMRALAKRLAQQCYPCLWGQVDASSVR